MPNYYEHRLREINMLLGIGLETHSPQEAEKLKHERDIILRQLNTEDNL